MRRALLRWAKRILWIVLILLGCIAPWLTPRLFSERGVLEREPSDAGSPGELFRALGQGVAGRRQTAPAPPEVPTEEGAEQAFYVTDPTPAPSPPARNE